MSNYCLAGSKKVSITYLIGFWVFLLNIVALIFRPNPFCKRKLLFLAADSDKRGPQEESRVGAATACCPVCAIRPVLRRRCRCRGPEASFQPGGRCSGRRRAGEPATSTPRSCSTRFIPRRIHQLCGLRYHANFYLY